MFSFWNKLAPGNHSHKEQPAHESEAFLLERADRPGFFTFKCLPWYLDGPASFLFSLHCVSQHFLWDGYDFPSQGMDLQPLPKATEDIFAFPTGGRAMRDVAVSQGRLSPMSLPIACASSSTVILCLISTSPLVRGIFFLFFFVSCMELDTCTGI